MELRLAKKSGLPRLYAFFAEAVENLNKNGIRIWDDVYPACALESDIENGGLYLVEDGGELMSVFALCDTNECDGSVSWEDNGAKALFIYRLAVNVSRLGKGLGQAALKMAAEEAGRRGAEYLRLLVGDQNLPAINLYRKCGFREAVGVYEKVVSDEITLHELGFEIKTK